MPYHDILEQNHGKKSQALPRGMRNMRKPVSRLSEQTGLPSHQTGLQADLPGLGLALHQNPSPSPKKPVCAGASPFCKPKTSLSDSQSHKFISMNTETATNNNTVDSDDEPIPDDLGLLTVSGSDDSDDDDDNDSTDAEAPSAPPVAPQPAPRPAHPGKPAAATKAKLTAFFKGRRQRRRLEHAEEVRLRELEITRRKKAKARADGNERTHQYRDRIRAAKIADGYVPGTKRIVAATRRAGRPWSPRAILQELHKSNPKDFQHLREQTIRTWLTHEGGTSRWKDMVLKRVEEGKGNTPGGQTTRCGVLATPVPRNTQEDQ
ncbi:hypothetical protein B0H13DRAFT_1906651 [Mycena leptocephala]|nr:hypothetical protein B0H13DRAFT_1906651 [Mycena leptocephala]